MTSAGQLSGDLGRGADLGMGADLGGRAVWGCDDGDVGDAAPVDVCGRSGGVGTEDCASAR
jgi:hypothetical protein